MATMIPMTGNSFLVGVVEDVMDPAQLGRLRVRWVGIHTDNKTKIPTNTLPWANVLGSIYSASISGVGFAPVGIVCGAMVFGIPLDDGYQEFLVMGTLAGNRSVFSSSSLGFNDPAGEYPRSGVTGDINKKAGGNADTGSSFNASSDTISSDIPGATDPTAETKTEDTTAYPGAPWMPTALGEIGQNQTDNPDRIKEYVAVTGQMREAYATWCASFVAWVLGQVDINNSRSAASRSYLTYGHSVGTTDVTYGSIAVFGVPNSGQGHVCFVAQDTGDSLVCVGAFSDGSVSRYTLPKTSDSLVLLDCVYPTNLNGK